MNLGDLLILFIEVQGYVPAVVGEMSLEWSHTPKRDLTVFRDFLSELRRLLSLSL